MPKPARDLIRDAAGSGPSLAAAGLPLCGRLLLGGVFAFSGWSKLRDPQFFAFAIKAFRLGLPESWIVALSFVLAWLEVLCAGLLVLGAWTRAAAAITAGLMILFSGLILSLLVRGLSVDCPCFGASSFLCTGPLGACHLARNVLLAALALYVARRGPGALALDGRTRLTAFASPAGRG